MTLGRIIAEIEDDTDEEMRSDWISLSNEFIDRLMFDGLVDD